MAPSPEDLEKYISGTHFSSLYGSGPRSAYASETLLSTLCSAHPWISAPLIVAGVVLFAAGWRRRVASWNGVAIVLGGALSFLPFELWCGAYDTQAFHLPAPGPSSSWRRRRPAGG